MTQQVAERAEARAPGTLGRAWITNYGGPWLHLDAEPHVMMRARRVFARGQTVGVIRLRATPEVCRDLLWICERWPLDIHPDDRRLLTARATAHDNLAEICRTLLDGQVSPRAFPLAIEPRPYQRVAAELVLQAGGVLIADDVGLGKTVEAICVLAAADARPALVVTLTHLPEQWRREIARFCPQLNVHVVRKGTPYDVTRPHGWRPKKGAPGEQPGLLATSFPDVLIMNYHKLAGWADVLAGTIRTVVFDEVQELRTGGSAQKYHAASAIAEGARYKVGLSATPIYNYGEEFHPVLGVLRPDALGERHEFLTEWCIPIAADKHRLKDPRAFGTYLRAEGLMIRRTRRDVGRELPKLTRVVQHVESDPKALDAVEDAACQLARLILARETGWEARGQATRELDWRVRQATGIAKAPYVAEFVKLLVDAGEQVVLYGWHREVYSIWTDRLKDCWPVMFTGSESPPAKQRALDDFLAGKARVLIMSLRAGAGVDGLQRVCRTVVFGELDWSFAVHVQNTGRVERDGQPDPVVAYYLVADSGSDPVVADVLGLKREQMELSRDPQAADMEPLERDEGGVRRLAEAYLAKRKEEVR